MDGYQVLPEEKAVRFERRLPAPIDRVWRYLIESNLRQTWLNSGELDLMPGTRSDVLFRHKDITREAPPEKWAEMHEHGHKSWWEVVECQPPRLLRVLWGSDEEAEVSEVSFELAETGDEVKITLTHRGLPDLESMANVSGGWHSHLHALAQRLEGREPNDFWSTVLQAEAEYQKALGIEGGNG